MQLVCSGSCQGAQRLMPLAAVKGASMHQIVPKASYAAEAVQPLVPADAPRVDGFAAALACPHTGAPCPALAALFPPLGRSLGASGSAPTPDGEAWAWIRALAPCAACRTAAGAGRDKFRHLRLGQREREILLAAAGADRLVLTEPGMSRSVSAARRRAAQSLVKAGLLAPAALPEQPKVPGVARTQRATVALTPLGHYVMAAYGRFLTAGKPIRWTRPARGAELPGDEPSELTGEVLARSQAALRETLDDLKGVLVAAVARPSRSPGLLDTLTRRLEHKTTILKAVLARAEGRAPA